MCGGWFVRSGSLLDHLGTRRGEVVLPIAPSVRDPERRRLTGRDRSVPIRASADAESRGTSATTMAMNMRSVQRLRNALPRGEFFRGALTIVAGTGAGQLIVLVSSPVLTRLYSPSDYGVFSVATSILAILVSVTCLRYEFAIPLPEDDVAAANVLALSLLAALAMSLAAGVVLWLLGPWLLALLGASALSPYVLLLVPAQVGGGITSALINWAVRTKDFSEMALNRLVQSGSLVAVQIGLGAMALGAPGLLIGAVTGSIAGSSRLAQAAWRTNAVAIRGVTRRGILVAANRYRRFPIFSSWSALLGSLGLRAPLLLLVAFYGTEVGGQYALAERILYLPLTLVAGSVGQVFIAHSARLVRDQPGDLRKLFTRTTWSLASTAIGPAVLIAVTVPSLAGPVFGQEWQEAGLFTAILVAMFYLAFVMTSTGDVLYVLERQGLHLVREILRLTLLGGSVFAAATMHLSPVGAIVVLNAAGCLTYVLYGLITWFAISTYRPHPQLASEAGTSDTVDHRRVD